METHPSGGIPCSGWDTRQPNRVLANTIAGDDLEGWPGAGKVRLAAAEYERAEVETILVDETEVGQTRCQGGPGDVDLTLDVLPQSAHKRVDALRDECGVWADRLQRTRDDPFWLLPPCRREVVVAGIPLRSILVPVAHDLVDPSTIQAAGQAADVIHEMTAKCSAGRRQLQRACDVIDVAVEG